MKYTKFFSGYVNTQGSPNLEPDQFKQMMNLIHLEGQIEGINQIIEKFKNTDNPQKYEFVKVGINQKITQVSKNRSPEELIHSWFEQ
jgi:hypothetical protein